jgi:3-deoxy-7-phosphoheptulonate synthase
VESKSQILETAHAVREAGANALRGGVFKPRTSPYSFQGLGEQGLEFLAEAREQTGMPIVVEIMSQMQLDMMHKYVDVFQVGARNMQNFNLLRALGETRKTILLKRGLSATIEELLMSAEYLLAGGNKQVILCERGIRTFETTTRNTTDINAIPVLKKLTHLPVILDPSHSTGHVDYVAAIARAAIAAGADGLIVEVHPDPAQAVSDGKQSLKPEAFAEMIEAGQSHRRDHGSPRRSRQKARHRWMVNMEDGFSLKSSTIGIIGLGLMGGSLAMNLKGKCARLIGFDSHPPTLELALSKGIIDHAESDSANFPLKLIS